ncbi:hypothetical protein QUF70_03860 [Desulfobacterales bacterium HSG17]|nr:hypothetical protein [Desulfobacterales bacterium HSG17]
MNKFTLTLETVREKMRLSEHAADQAMRESPKTEDTEYDIFEQNTVDFISTELEDIRKSAEKELNQQKIMRDNIERDIQNFSLNQIVESAKNHVVRFHSELEEKLDSAKKKEAEAQRSYNLFCHQNQLTREPSYQDSKVLHVALIILAVLLESGINSFFFASASPIGILGGLFQAMFISISNVGSALLIGSILLPYKNHVDNKKQSRAKFFTTLYVICIFLFNLGAAHYRTLLDEDPFTAKIKTIPHLLQQPWSIDFEALNLLIIGMIFVVVALLKGYRFDDVYPGFGAMHRKLKSSPNYSGVRVEAKKSLNTLIDTQIRQAQTLLQNARSKIQSYKSSISQSQAIVSSFSKIVESAENVCNNALWEYRNDNAQIRSSQPPEYFSQKHSYSNHLFEIDLSEEKTACTRIEINLSEIQNAEEHKLNTALREINEQALLDITSFFKKS